MTDNRTHILPHPLLEYADPDITEVWTDPWRFRIEREMWVTVMEHQYATGAIACPDGVLDAYRDVAAEPIGRWTLSRIDDLERITRHDVKARVETFNEAVAERWCIRFAQSKDEALRAIQFAHVGLTSADIVDNVSLIQMSECARRLQHIIVKESRRPPEGIWATVHAEQYAAMERCQRQIPFRGLKGPVGTQQDLYDLFGGDVDASVSIRVLEAALRSQFGLMGPILTNTGQVYPRSIDTQVASDLMTLAYYQPRGHKEPWLAIMNGYFRMITEYSGDQWNEGDVSTSVIRRVALSGIFMAASAMLRGAEL